jgi:molybdopterin-guanine dinucleotide biosynthesis protein A
MGRDKTAIVVGGRTLLDIARAALAGAGRTVVVGAGHEVVEDPPGSGPVAAVRAGLALVSAPVVVLLAADLPWVTTAAVEALVAAAPAVAVDGDGRDQHLLAAYPVDLLQAAVGGSRMREVTETVAPQRVLLPGEPWRDCDTPADLAAVLTDRR